MKIPKWLELGWGGLYLLSGTRAVTSLILVLFVSAAFFWGNQWPLLFGGVAAVLGVGGVLLYVYSRRRLGAFTQAGTGERRQLWGRERSVSEIRELLTSLNMIGLWSASAGVATGILIALG